MTFNTRHDLKRAAFLLEQAAGDLRRALAHSPGQEFWTGYQAQAQTLCLEVCASMDMGAFDLPHPWDLRTVEERAYAAIARAALRGVARLVGDAPPACTSPGGPGDCYDIDCPSQECNPKGGG